MKQYSKSVQRDTQLSMTSNSKEKWVFWVPLYKHTQVVRGKKKKNPADSLQAATIKHNYHPVITMQDQKKRIAPKK